MKTVRQLLFTGTLLVAVVMFTAPTQAGPMDWLFGSNKSTPPPAVARSKSPGPVKAPVVEIKVGANVDERLFLLRLLNELNDSWPDENLPADQLQNTLASLHQQATNIRDYTHDHASDGQLTGAYDQFLHTVDAYRDYLADIERIERQVTSRTENERGTSALGSVSDGLSVGYVVSQYGVSSNKSLVAGGLMALGSYLWDDYQKGKERDAARTETINSARSKLREATDEYLAMCRKTAGDLTTKYGWKPGEAGFDESADYEATRAALIQHGNSEGLVQLVESLQAKRPRGPFLVRDKAYLRGLNVQGEIATEVAAAKECLAATALVPAGKFYDDCRVDLLGEAADVLDRVANREAGKNGWGAAYNANAALAVQAWGAVLRYDQDFSGVIRERRAWDLFKSGDLAEAVKATGSLTSLRQNDPQFAYNMACLSSDTNDAGNSLAWLKQAVVALGWNDIASIKTDPDLATVRAKKAGEMAELTAVRGAWKIDYGVFNDDLIVENDSSFTLTHVTVEGSITPNNKAWEKALTVDAIPPGKSYKWSSVLSVPGSKVDVGRSSIRVRCDQGECQPTLMP